MIWRLEVLNWVETSIKVYHTTIKGNFQAKTPKRAYYYIIFPQFFIIIPPSSFLLFYISFFKVSWMFQLYSVSQCITHILLLYCSAISSKIKKSAKYSMHGWETHFFRVFFVFIMQKLHNECLKWNLPAFCILCRASFAQKRYRGW